jgi:hypothetical protein
MRRFQRFLLLPFLMLLLAGTASICSAVEFDSLSGPADFDWSYEIPVKLTGQAEIPLRLEVDHLSVAQRQDGAWQFTVYPYVYGKEGRTRHYLVESSGIYVPVSGHFQNMIPADAMRFQTVVWSAEGQEQIYAIKRMTVSGMAAADRNIYTGSFKDLIFDVWAETETGIRRLTNIEKKWVAGSSVSASPVADFALALRSWSMGGLEPEWPFTLNIPDDTPHPLTIRFETAPIPEAVTNGEYWGSLITPYVIDAEGTKKYFADFDGMYKPVSGFHLLRARKENRLLSFHITFFDVKLADQVRAIHTIRLPLLTKPSRQANKVRGNFRNLNYEIYVETDSGIRSLESIQKKWIFGDIIHADPPAMFALVYLPGSLSSRTYEPGEIVHVTPRPPAAEKAPLQVEKKARPEKKAESRKVIKKPMVEEPALVVEEATEKAPEPEPAAKEAPVTEAVQEEKLAPEPEQEVKAEPITEAVQKEEPQPPAKPAVEGLVFSMYDVPMAAKRMLRRNKPILVSGASVNGKDASLLADLFDDHFTIKQTSGEHFAEGDEVSFTLQVPGLAPMQILMIAGEPVIPEYTVQHQLQIAVTDNQGKPLQGIPLQASYSDGRPDAIIGTSDADGIIHFNPKLHTEELTLKFTGNDSFRASVPVEIQLSDNDAVREVHIKLSPQVSRQDVTFKVVDPCANLIDDATIKMELLNGDASTVLTADPATETGFYNGSLPAEPTDRFRYTVSAPGFQTSDPASLSLANASSVITVELAPQPLPAELKFIITKKEAGKNTRLNNAKGTISYQDGSCTLHSVKLRYNRADTTYSARTDTTPATRITLQASAGSEFERYIGPVSSASSTVVMNQAKPFLYVVINPNNQLKRGPIRKNPSLNFKRFKEKFLDMIISLDMEEEWHKQFSKIFIYSVNKNQPPNILRQPGDLKANWVDSGFRKSILNKIQLRNSFVPYKDVVGMVSSSLSRYGFADDKPVRGVLVYILGAPPTAIEDPYEDLIPLQKLMADERIIGIVAQYADSSSRERQDFTSDSEVFRNLRLLEMNIDQEFNDLYFGASMEYVKELLGTLLRNHR